MSAQIMKFDNPVDRAEFRAVTIRVELEGMVRSRDLILEQIEHARSDQDDVVLGYPSWSAYVAKEFGEALAELGRDDRRDVVAILSDTGMSTRAIASVVGVSVGTVHSDLRAGVQSLNTSQVSHGGTPADDDVHEGRVVGLDGKSYAAERPERRKPRRKPLTDQYRDAVFELDKAVDRLMRVTEDDRFSQYRADLVQWNAHPLQRISKQLWKARQALGQYPAAPVDLGGDDD